MSMEFILQEIETLISVLEAEAKGQEVDADHACDLAAHLMLLYPDIKVSMKMIIDRLSVRKMRAA